MGYEVEKVWKHKDNTCVVIMTDLGHRCGYAGISSSHPLYRKKYSEEIPKHLKPKIQEILEKPIGKRGVIDIFCSDEEHPRIGILFDVHGGITYSNGLEDYPIKNKDTWWFGYDCAHVGDGKDLSVLSPKLRELEEDFPSKGIVRSLDYCISECESLSSQLEELQTTSEPASG